MTGVHDMGGQPSSDPIPLAEEEKNVGAQPWHNRALAITVAAGFLGMWNIDASRHSRERLAEEDYLRFTYYERWLAALANLLVERGLLREEELLSGVPTVPGASQRCIRGGEIKALLDAGGPTARDAETREKFRTGDRVKSRTTGNRFVKNGHHRCPSYAAGCTGTIVRSYGAHVLPDSNAHFLGEVPEPLYSIAFKAGELWGDGAEYQDDLVMVDLWESYLDPVRP